MTRYPASIRMTIRNMPKVLTVIAALIVLIIAVEAGYFWGLRRSASFAIPRVNIIQQSPAETIPTPFSADAIPSLLSYRAAVNIGQNAVNPNVWLSEWTIGQGGTLVSLTENSVSLDYGDSGHRNFVFPAGIPITHSKWSQSSQQSSPAQPAEFAAGDSIGIVFTIETASGNFKRVEITKTVD